MPVTDLVAHPVHLGLGATAEAEPRFTGSMDWYERYAERRAGDGADGRLVSLHEFTRPWDMWEMHPRGSEVVLCTAGSLTLHHEKPDGSTASVTLGPGTYAINEPGTWHTTDVEDRATVLFITAGAGTQHRPR